jgi:dihydrofolate reductase
MGGWRQGAGPFDVEGDDPPFRYPVFVVTHHVRMPVSRGATTFTFVTDGIESALEQAHAAAGEGDVAVGGGASIARQFLDAGLVDELRLHILPVLLGNGLRLFENHLAEAPRTLERIRMVSSPGGVVHVNYRVAG